MSTAASHVLAVPTTRTIGVPRFAFGAVLFVQALAHAAPATWIANYLPSRVVTPLWLVATTSLLGAAFGLWGMPVLTRRWRLLAVLGTFASIILLGVASIPLALVGALIDVPLLIMAGEWHPARSGHDGRIVLASRARSAVRATMSALGWMTLAYVSAVIVARPWHVGWGTTAAERQMELPGDVLVPDARYQMDHALTIAAPPDSVWPWLAQLGQDRGGFYSYAWLERMIGDHITNADRIHPEWQQRAVGDLVRATQPDYLGGIFGDELGWRILQLEPGRAMVLEGWGAFVLRPQAGGTTRFHIRLRGHGEPSLLGVALGPLSVFGFEPAHFIMERGMMLGIKARAEGMMQP